MDRGLLLARAIRLPLSSLCLGIWPECQSNNHLMLRLGLAAYPGLMPGGGIVGLGIFREDWG